MFKEYLYKTRLFWTKHVIPVCILDRRTNVYLEAVITSAFAKKVESEEELELEEEDEKSEEIKFDKPLNIKILTNSNKFNPLLEVNIEDIYPSNRKLTIINNKIPGKIRLESFYPEDIEQYRPKEPISLDILIQALDYYKDCKWTKNELRVMCNNNNELDVFITSNMITNSKRICYITGKLEDEYYMNSVKNENKHKVVNSIDELYDNYQSCDLCNLGIKRIQRNCNIVRATKLKSQKLFIIGEAPGVQEELENIPFNPKAPAGNILSKSLELAGISRDDCYITNSVICRPEAEEGKAGKNGTPNKEHITACNARLKNELLIVNPKIIIILGKSAYYAFFGKELDSVLSSVGWIECEHWKVYFLAHPSYIVRQYQMAQPENKKKIKEDYINHFINIKNAL